VRDGRCFFFGQDSAEGCVGRSVVGRFYGTHQAPPEYDSADVSAPFTMAPRTVSAP
jgi:hypothetical protein